MLIGESSKILKLSKPNNLLDALYGIFQRGFVAISPVILVFGFHPNEKTMNRIKKNFLFFKIILSNLLWLKLSKFISLFLYNDKRVRIENV